MRGWFCFKLRVQGVSCRCLTLGFGLKERILPRAWSSYNGAEAAQGEGQLCSIFHVSDAVIPPDPPRIAVSDVFPLVSQDLIK